MPQPPIPIPLGDYLLKLERLTILEPVLEDCKLLLLRIRRQYKEWNQNNNNNNNNNNSNSDSSSSNNNNSNNSNNYG